MANYGMEAHERDGLGGNIGLQANKRGDLYTVKGLPDFAYLVNSGVCWQAKSATTAAVVALPTTASILDIQNSAAAGSGISLVILAVGAIQVAGPASMVCYQLIYCPQILKQAALVADVTPVNLKPLSGTYAGAAIVDNAGTVVDNGWFPICTSANNPLASTPGAGIWTPVHGMLVIPPGGSCGFHCMASTTAVTIQLAVQWAEIVL